MASTAPSPARADDDDAALAGALPLVCLTDILDGVVAAGQARLEEVGEEVAGRNDGERKRILAMRLSGIRQRLLRLLMVSQWSNKVRLILCWGGRRGKKTQD